MTPVRKFVFLFLIVCAVWVAEVLSDHSAAAEQAKQGPSAIPASSVDSSQSDALKTATNATSSETPQSDFSSINVFEGLLSRATNGNADAEAELGARYGWYGYFSNGGGFPKDYSQAVKWARLAAEQGNSRGQNILGVSYARGQGVPQDYVEAVKWYRKAAEQDYAKAQCNLGFCYYRGQGVPQDFVQAAVWWRKSAEQGYAIAQYAIGFIYYWGRGVDHDYVEAYKWTSLAASQGNENARKGLYVMTGPMTQAMVADAQRRAAAFVPRTERTRPGGENSTPTPEIAEGTVVAGTGFFVTDDGYLVTCAHVVRGASSFHVQNHEWLDFSPACRA